jgi:hypothetical protein
VSGLPRCYVAGPLGFTEAGRYYYRKVYLPALATVVTPVDPWALTSASEVAEARAAGQQREMALEIGRRNAEADPLKRAARGVSRRPRARFGDRRGARLRCCARQAVLLRSDLREAGEEGVALNLQVVAFAIERSEHQVRWAMGDPGFEPGTSSLSEKRSNRLS